MDAVTRVFGDDPGSPGSDGALLSICRLSQMINSDRPIEKALHYALEVAVTLTHSDKAAVLLMQDGSDKFVLKSGYKLTKPTEQAKDPCVAESLARQCVANTVPIIEPNLAENALDELLKREHVASAACVPIAFGSKVFGALVVLTKKRRTITRAEVEILQIIANQAALSILRSREAPGVKLGKTAQAPAPPEAHLIEFSNKKIRELSMLNQVSEAMISTLDLEELLDIVLKQAMLAVGAGVGSLLLVDESSQMMTIRSARGLSPKIIRNTRVRVGQGISGWVAAHGVPVLVHKAKDDERFRAIAFRDDITSAMSVPLKTQDRVIGVLNVSTIEFDRLFSDRDLELLGTLANQMAVAIDNARLHTAVQNRNRQLSLLLEVAGAVSATLELDDVLEILVQQIRGLTHVNVCCILLYSENTKRFRVGVLRGPDTARVQDYLNLSLPAAIKAVEAGSPAYTSDLAAYADFSAKSKAVIKRDKLRSMLCVPLKVKETVIGTVLAYSGNADAFTGSDIPLLTSVGELAGVAVQNARVYRRQYRMAQLLQNDLMPKAPLNAPGIDVGQVYSPAREVGGDYFDFIKVSPDKIGVVVADVSGCSIPAASFISSGKHVLRAYARDNNSPSDVLRRVNRIIYDDTPPEMFISLFYGIFDLKNKTLRYAMAGHEPPILYRATTKRFRLLQSPGILLGVLPDAEFAERKVSFKSGDILTLYTDGLSGAVSNGRQFGREPIKKEMGFHKLKPAQMLADNIYEKLSAFAEDGMADDVAILTVKIL
ncbi:MAG: GAF domain-containing protein [Armatimonadota bacterium]|nr:GAF domain-containing protein [Armatimonadota bacterium]